MSVPDMQPTQERIGAHFSRSERLRLSRDFQAVFAGKRSFAGRLMVVWIGQPGEKLRLGVIASKRTFRRAVDRNRAKRLLREAFRLSRHEIREKRDLVIVARKRILGAKCADVQSELLYLLNKSRRYADREQRRNREKSEPAS